MSDTAAPAAPAAAPPAAPAAAPSPAPAAASGFLGGDTPSAPASPPPGAPAAPVHFFDGTHHEGGKFKEGWSENLRAAGFERLANKGALAKDEATFLRSLDDTLGLVGKKTAGGYPQAGASEQEIADYRRAAGVPDEPAGYTLKPETLPDGIEWDEAGAGEFAAVLHRHHAPAGLAKELGQMWAQQQAKVHESAKNGFEERINTLSAESAKVFAKEWGEEVEERKTANSDFVKARGLDLADPVLRVALSHPEIVKLVDEARRALREAPLPGVEAGVFNGSGSPRQQAREIMQANPRWDRDPALAARVQQLHALEAQQAKRRGGAGR